MFKTYLKINQDLVECEILDNWQNSVQVLYVDPYVGKELVIWVNKNTVVFPKFSELVM